MQSSGKDAGTEKKRSARTRQECCSTPPSACLSRVKWALCLPCQELHHKRLPRTYSSLSPSLPPSLLLWHESRLYLDRDHCKSGRTGQDGGSIHHIDGNRLSDSSSNGNPFPWKPQIEKSNPRIRSDFLILLAKNCAIPRPVSLSFFEI